MTERFATRRWRPAGTTSTPSRCSSSWLLGKIETLLLARSAFD
jgi:hypothetical protein